MSVQRQSAPTSPDPDLEATAELPVLDVAAYEERAGSTDTWHMPALPTSASEPAAAPATDARSRQLEIDLHVLSENLRDVEERLTRKGERLAELERDLASARAERAAADERAAAELALAQERARAELAAAEERADARIRAAEERAYALAAELKAARAELAEEQSRAAQLQTRVEDYEVTVRAHQTRDYERAKLLAQRDQELAHARRDISDLAARVAHYLETLQTLEGRRVIFDGQLLTLDEEIGRRDVELDTLRAALEAAAARERSLASELHRAQERIEVLEREVSALSSSLAGRNLELQQAQQANESLERTIAELTRTTAAQLERIGALEAAANDQSTSLQERRQEVERATREREAISLQISELQASVAALEEAVAEKDRALAAARAERDAALTKAAETEAALEKRVEAAQLRAQDLERDLAIARAEVIEHTAAMRGMETARDEQARLLAAAEARAVELQRQTEDHEENIRVLQEELRASLNRGTELEGDLRAAEDALLRLETELRAKSSKLDELSRTQEEWRQTIDSARESLAQRDSLIRRLETEAAHSSALLGNIQKSIGWLDPAAESGSHEIAPEGPVRLLIRMDGDTEVVHVLGRKTTVGRTPDNDLQIDAKFISRNHAVILAGPNHTIIEDLNSTNGVAVNGRKISRHTLRDGDMVSIGKTTFRFATRPVMTERR